ncbi:MAG: DNA polymerase I [Bacteroidales bacterium]|nr:DNA polymerase I [Bacteroidales bacterium]MDY2935598.1 DNA polymerase I [Candidatus Cryptobacteroides sp.]
MSGKLYLLDGHALIFKMHYAFLGHPMKNDEGEDTSILFGFTKFLLELIEREKPTHIAVSFDPPGGTFRNKMYPAYKANRPPTPQLIIDALDPLIEICKAMNIPVLMMTGYEADDVIGSASKRAAREGYDVFMVTPDKDYGQLIEDHIWQYKPGKGGGEKEVLGVKEICAKYGIQSPLQVIDMLTICGDASDNVPGVKGVGEVGASKLVAKYGSVKGIYEHLDELTPRQRGMFEEAKDHIELSHELVTIKTDIDVPVATADMRLSDSCQPKIADLFTKYKFNSLRRYISNIGGAVQASVGERPEVSKSAPDKVAAAARKTGLCSVIVEAYSSDIFSKARRIIVAAPQGKDFIVAEGGCPEFKVLLEDPSVRKYGDDLKRQMNTLSASGLQINGSLRDLELMHYLIDPEKSHKLEVLAQSYLGISLDAPAGEAKATTGSLFDDIPDNVPLKDRSNEAAAIIELGRKIEGEMSAHDVTKLYESMEEPLSKVLSKMERNGVRVDLNTLKDFTFHLQQEMKEREARVRGLAGEPALNVSSPKQIGEVLFDKLKLSAKPKKNAGGTYSTDETTLMDIYDKHPIVEEILEFRAVKKLLSTYIEPFPDYVNPEDGKVHTTFNQALTATGRLSSSNPNLQNIPIRSERGKEIRKAFVPSAPDGMILSADYSQIELRIMAHLSGDEHMVNAFRNGVDVHAATASKIFKVPHEDVTQEQRRIAKTANFGIIYGISSFGLAQRLRIGRNEAKKIIDDYFASFPSIIAYIEKVKADARKNGYVETLFHRRRYLPDINSKNSTLRSLAERNAVNAPIQGTAADIIKLAMIAVDGKMTEAGLESKMVLQIHDELLFDVIPSELDVLRAIVVESMENVVKLSVPLTVECNHGKNWLEAH